jgi:catechol 2,3-dioxygenase-like lactoylglutathione lyase family enzyme
MQNRGEPEGEVEMLGDKDVVAVVAVKDLAVARRFYEETLGLAPDHDQPADADTALYRSGGSRLLVYVSSYAGTNQATAASWAVGAELDDVVAALAGKGVPFERYEFPDIEHEGDVHVMGGFRTAWFRDPDGNILNLVNQSP